MGKICSIMIDEGSNVNVASLRLVEKLSIPTFPHHKPYKMKWFMMWFPRKPLIFYRIGHGNLIISGPQTFVSKEGVSLVATLERHHINLTLGATLLNRVAYRTNLEESKEIQK
ncbi:hypothetical protein CR513_52007, partial [Mucuna pruriens]